MGVEYFDRLRLLDAMGSLHRLAVSLEKKPLPHLSTNDERVLGAVHHTLTNSSEEVDVHNQTLPDLRRELELNRRRRKYLTKRRALALAVLRQEAKSKAGVVCFRCGSCALVSRPLRCPCVRCHIVYDFPRAEISAISHIYAGR